MKEAETLAIDILKWLASEPDLFNRFSSLSGIDLSQLRSAAKEPGFLTGVIAFLVNHEPTLMQYCQTHNKSPEEIVQAYRALGGQIYM